MTFSEALLISYEAKGLMGARCKSRPDLGCIKWSELMGWIWQDPIQRASLPAPKLMFSEWEAVPCSAD